MSHALLRLLTRHQEDRLRGTMKSPLAPAAVVLLAYAFWILIQLPSSHNAVAFADTGTCFLRQSTASTRIDAVPAINGCMGYDGQFILYLALDPARARYYMDVPAYRYSRSFYALATKLISLDFPAAMPYVLVLINWFAVGAGTLFVGLWLQRKRVSPWYSLIYGLYPGLFVAVRFDLTEALAYALVTAAVFLFDFGGRHRLTAAGILFSIAILTRETTGLFALLYGLSLIRWRSLSNRSWGALRHCFARAIYLLVLAFAPYVCLKFFLRQWLGSFGFDSGVAPTAVPFAGLIAWHPFNASEMLEIRSIVVPGLICLGIGLWHVAQRRAISLPILVMIVNVVLLVVCLNKSSYRWCPDAARIATGVPLSALFALPSIDTVTATSRLWILTCAMFWLWLTLSWINIPIGRYV